MTWVTLDDSFGDHPKVVAAGAHAAILQVRALCYACRHLTDGLIPAAVVPSLVLDLEPRDWPAHMVTADLWEIARGGWTIHDFLHYNLSKRQVLGRRKAKKAAGLKGAKVRWGQAQIAGAMGPAKPVASSSQCPPPLPSPPIDPPSVEQSPPLRASAPTRTPNTNGQPPLRPFKVPVALDRTVILGADRRLRNGDWWRAEVRANSGVDFAAEILKAEAWLVANPKRPRKDLSRFLHNWLARAERREPEEDDADGVVEVPGT